ncbi:MAG: gliding motility-associated C-terminal domain-containing protein [Candidatus Desantisbacteria bacterium]
MASSTINIRGVSKQVIGTISGFVAYGTMSVPLNMAVVAGGSGWVGSASIPSGVEGTGTITVIATDISDQRATFTSVLHIDTILPEAPSIVADRNSTGGWNIHGTATDVRLVELWGGGKLYSTTIPQPSGYFAFNADPRMIPSGTTTLCAMSVDKAGNRRSSDVVGIHPPLRLSANLLPQLVNTSFEIHGAANQAIGMIKGFVSYGNGSVTLNMTITTDTIGGIGWVGSVSIPAGFEGKGTVTIFATDTYNQQATFTGTLNIDTIPPGTPTIVAIYIATAGWVIYGTATDATLVRLLVNDQPSGTTTPSAVGTFRFTLGSISATTTVVAVSRDKADNRAESHLLDIPLPLQLFADLPHTIGKMLEVHVTASQPLSTIRGKLWYGANSVILSMAVDKSVVVGNGNNGWVGSSNILAGFDGVGTVSIVAVDTYNQRAEFMGTLSIDTTRPAAPTIAVTNTTKAGWIVYGTATEVALIGLLVNNQPYGTTTPSAVGTFSFSLGSIATTTIVHAVSIDTVGNQTSSKPIVIPLPLQLFADLPQLVNTMIKVHGTASQVLGTISGFVAYGISSVPLSMVVNKIDIVGNTGGNGWVGSASILDKIDGVGTVTIFATDIYNQQATFIGTLSIDTIPPEIPTIVVTNTAKDGWVVYGTATEAVIVELLWANQKQKMATTITPNTMGTFSFSLGSIAATTTVQAVSRDKAGNWVESEPLYIYPPIVPPPGTPTIAATNTTTGDWMIYGTATEAVIVELWTNKGLYGTTTPSAEGAFSFSLGSSTATITVVAMSMNQAGNWAKSEPLYIYPPLLPSPATPIIQEVKPFQGTVGTTVLVAGAGYAASDSITILFGTNNNIQQTVANSEGLFSTTFTIDTQVYGTTAITASNGSVVAKNMFYILPQVVSMMPVTGTVGTVVTIAGTGYAASDNIIVAFGMNPTIQQTIANSSGLFSTTFTIDTQSYGTKTITAGSQVAMASNIFIIRPQVVRIMPTAGTVGTMVNIAGTGYAADDNIIVAFGTTVNIHITTARSNGFFSTIFTIDTQSYGTKTIMAKGVGAAGSVFHIMPAVYSVMPMAGPVGTIVTIKGNGYAVSEVIFINFGNTVSIATILSNVSGFFTASFVVNTQGDGTTTITCTNISSTVVADNTFYIGTRTGQPSPALSTPTTIAIPIRSENGGTITISGKLGQTTLKIPPDALAEDSQVMLTEISKSTGKLAVANFNVRQEKNITPVPDSYRSLVCTNQANGKPVSSTRQAMQLCIPYGDENHDGIVDETSICVETLKIFKLNEVSNRWEMLTDSYPVATKCEVRANIYEFGIYAIMSYEPVYSLSDVKVYPNPFYPNMNQKCKFSPLPSGRLTISIYNSAGEQVRVLRQYSNEGVEWDGNNDQGESVASGIYFYLIKNTEGKRTGKIGLVR